MTPKNRTLEGKNRTLGGRGGQKLSKIVGHHLCTFPFGKFYHSRIEVLQIPQLLALVIFVSCQKKI